MIDLINKLNSRELQIGIDFLSGCFLFVAGIYYCEANSLNVAKFQIGNAVQNYKEYFNKKYR